ncbi:MAG: hypothetical protein RLZZ342_109 [Candidatus Parcubacteria bacterium]
MTGLLSTALTGVFALSGVAGPIALADTQNAVAELTYPTYTVSMTAYNAVEAQTDGDPHTTASGAFSDPDVVIARSKDLADELPFGTVVEVVPAGSGPGCGISAVSDKIGLRVVADAMHPRKRNQVDILFDTKPVSVNGKKINPAVVFGICKDVEIRVVGRIDINKMPKNQAELAILLEATSLALNK